MKKKTSKTKRAARSCAPLTGSALTLTAREIFDLGKAAQVIPWKANLADSQLSDEDAETEYTVFTRAGGVTVCDDDGTPHKYKSGAYLTEYPEEGTFPLGEAQNAELSE